MTIKTYTLFTVLYSNLKARNITSVLGSFKTSNSTAGPFRVKVEINNIFITAATFNSSRNCKAYCIIRGY
jgi:hypothetical protein